MYICICNAIKEADLRAAAVGCDGDAETTYAKLGKAPNCGQCLVKAAKILTEERTLASCENVAL